MHPEQIPLEMMVLWLKFPFRCKTVALQVTDNHLFV